MPNTNPIKPTDPGNYKEYIIPAALANKILTITTSTSITEAGWNLDVTHSLSLKGDPVDFNASPDITEAQIGVCDEIKNKKLSLCTNAGRIRNGGDGEPPKVNYKLTIKAGNTVIDEFTAVSDHTNPAHFYTKILLKLGS